MLTLLLIMLGIMLTTWLVPFKRLWLMMMTQTSISLIMSMIIMINPLIKSKWNKMSWSLSIDSMKAPLMMLSFWLIPVSMLASISHITKTSSSSQRMFMTLMLLMLMALKMTFSTTNLMVFFLGFEATLVPTLFLITRWGMQEERMEAGYYFVFYTLISSLPLFISLLVLYKVKNSLKMLKMNLTSKMEKKMLALSCIMAFLVKVPIFGLHLWLPKAHVEAPVAGSMILAAMLLKMGGYGFMRLTTILMLPFKKKVMKMLIPFCCWGGLLTSLICLSQTDLKSLMAYSSVSHMSFMMAGLCLISYWGMSGGVIIMMAHGLVSSAMFCMANMFYERTSTRTLKMSRGMKKIYALLPSLWLMFACAKLGLPPFPNAMGELLIFSSILSFSLTKFMPMILGMLFTAMFSLSIYQLLKSGKNFKWKMLKKNMKEREYMTLMLHILPLIMLMLKPKIIVM